MGELARKPGCPELAKTPLELLTPRPGEGFNIVDQWAAPVLFAGCGVLGVVLLNLHRKRPIWAGIYMHGIAGGISWYIGRKLQQSKFAARAERDAILKHYITLHPEDFPPYERKRWKDMYFPFRPLR